MVLGYLWGVCGVSMGQQWVTVLLWGADPEGGDGAGGLHGLLWGVYGVSVGYLWGSSGSQCCCGAQIQKVVMALGDYMGASCHACIGGTNVRAEVQKLQLEAPHIIVGTPGRVFDMLNRRYLCECFGGPGGLLGGVFGGPQMSPLGFLGVLVVLDLQYRREPPGGARGTHNVSMGVYGGL